MLLTSPKSASPPRPPTPAAPPAPLGIPFRTVEEAWFWFISAVEAREAGARPSRAKAKLPRPCEPIDIYRLLDRLYRNRRLRFEHMETINLYGRLRMPPEWRRPHERQAYHLWREAMQELDAVFKQRGIVRNIFKPTEKP